MSAFEAADEDGEENGIRKREITKAANKKSVKWHPDKQGSEISIEQKRNFNDIMRWINDARDIMK